jgi:hypothetical protein
MRVFLVLVVLDHCYKLNVQFGFEEVVERVFEVRLLSDLVRSSFLPLLIQGVWEGVDHVGYFLRILKSDKPVDRLHWSIIRNQLGWRYIGIVMIHFSGPGSFFGVEFQDFDNGLGILRIIFFCDSGCVQ